MKVTHPIKTSEGDEYLVLIESMAMDTLFDEEDIAFLNGVNLVEIRHSCKYPWLIFVV